MSVKPAKATMQTRGEQRPRRTPARALRVTRICIARSSNSKRRWSIVCAAHLQQDAEPGAPRPAFEPPAPHDDAPYSRFVREQRLDRESQLLLLLALAPWLRPDFFDRILQKSPARRR